jgi:hypothetical protein
MYVLIGGGYSADGTNTGVKLYGDAIRDGSGNGGGIPSRNSGFYIFFPYPKS